MKAGWIAKGARVAMMGAALAMAGGLAAPASAQSGAQGSNAPIDSDLVRPTPITPSPGDHGATYAPPPPTIPAPVPGTAPVATGAPAVPAPASDATYHEDDLIGAAESVFGKGAKGLAQVIEKILKKQGEPNGYITGREAGGAFALGLRYGSGTLFHKIEGKRPVYWTGPSLGFDAGASAGNTFVLVYNLYNTDDLYHRFGAGEGQAYVVGGFNVSYMRHGDIVLIPVRLGVGLRLGVNAGYMKFSRKQNWFPL